MKGPKRQFYRDSGEDPVAAPPTHTDGTSTNIHGGVSLPSVQTSYTMSSSSDSATPTSPSSPKKGKKAKKSKTIKKEEPTHTSTLAAKTSDTPQPSRPDPKNEKSKQKKSKKHTAAKLTTPGAVRTSSKHHTKSPRKGEHHQRESLQLTHPTTAPSQVTASGGKASSSPILDDVVSPGIVHSKSERQHTHKKSKQGRENASAFGATHVNASTNANERNPETLQLVQPTAVPSALRTKEQAKLPLGGGDTPYEPAGMEDVDGSTTTMTGATTISSVTPQIVAELAPDDDEMKARIAQELTVEIEERLRREFTQLQRATPAGGGTSNGPIMVEAISVEKQNDDSSVSEAAMWWCGLPRRTWILVALVFTLVATVIGVIAGVVQNGNNSLRGGLTSATESPSSATPTPTVESTSSTPPSNQGSTTTSNPSATGWPSHTDWPSSDFPTETQTPLPTETLTPSLPLASQNDVLTCISVIDENNGYVPTNEWADFRATYPNRPMCLLQPTASIGGLGIPDAFYSEGINTYTNVTRDGHDIFDTSDWYNLCMLEESRKAGITTVVLFIDNSGSMTTSAVQNAHAMFTLRMEDKGMTIVSGVYNDMEDYISPCALTDLEDVTYPPWVT